MDLRLMRIFVLLGVLLLLTSCTNLHRTVTVPQKTFQYNYQGPSRVIINSDFAKQLSSGAIGKTVRMKLGNNAVENVRLGQNYYSASGHNCRRYTLQSNFQRSACKINGRWHNTSPIIISK